MKKYFYLYISIVVLALLCVFDVIFEKWFNLFSNVLWLFLTIFILKFCNYVDVLKRELLEQNLLNEKFCKIMAGLAIDCDKVSETFDEISNARHEAYGEANKAE